MLLLTSSCMGDYPRGLPKSGIDFADNIAFETSDDLPFAHSFLGAAAHIFPGPSIKAKSDHNDSIKSSIGLAVAAPVQPVPVSLSRGSGYRIRPAQ